eukprot:TRINITY_DN15392_c0_g2_i1.p2 TRINITY_DN15392_c0_g2~~TRINITY_DN15392_c0_g2_i1.p2  ORF type:complete len:222 (+),score=45.64 TRINITY_DN15392_c0_g2_i1:804-1469(+)
MLELLLDQQDEDGNRLSEAEIEDELGTFMMAGHETIAHTLTYALFLLAREQPKQQLARDEVLRVLNGREDLAFEDLSRIPYVDAVVQEALRLYPTVPTWTRIAATETTIGGYNIPKGGLVLINNVAIGQNPVHFPDPKEFRPERWLQNAPTDAFAHLPFGGGNRVCPGKRFAIQEASVVLAALLQRCSFHLPEGTPRDIATIAAVTQQPKAPVHIQVALLK